MTDLKKLKETLADIEAAIESKATPDNIRKIMKSKLPELEKQIAEAEEAEKKPKPKVISKDALKHKPHVHKQLEDTYSEFHPTNIGKVEPEDELAECKKILEAANYDVKSKTVKTKNGKKIIKTREPRQDRSIIADRTKSVFTTITKAFSSEEDKDANKALLDMVETIKELMIKFLNSLDKLVASKDVDKIKTIKELLKKLVD